jgi:hypothetical protein
MRRLVPLSLCCLVLLAVGTADAETLSSKFPTLIGTIQARIAAFGTSGLSKTEKKQKATLGKVVKAMNADTDDLAKSLVYIGKTVKGVDAVYPTDGTLSPLLDDMVGSVVTDVTRRGSELFYSIQALPDGAAKTKSQTLSDASEADVIASATATPRTARVALLKNALTSIAKAERIVRKAGGGGGVTTTALDVDVDGQRLHVPAASGDFLYTVSYDSAMDRFSLSVRGTAGGVVHAFTMMVPDPDFGDRMVPPGPLTSYTPPVPGGGPYLLTSGNITFTAWDPAGGKVAARFDLTFTNPNATVVLSNGSLSSTSLAVQ